MTSCSVLGCDSKSKKHPNYKFHRLPVTPGTRESWLRVLGPPSTLTRTLYVCSKHFEPRSYILRGNTRMLARHAVPTLFVPKIERPDHDTSSAVQPLPGGRGNLLFIRKIAWLRAKLEQARRSLRFHKAKQRKVTAKLPINEKSKSHKTDVSVCRVCLSADARLYAVKDKRMEDVFLDLAGAPLPQDGMPSRLCSLCHTELSKCASFRDRCQRAQELLETLKEWGPLKMTEIAAIGRHSHKLTRNLTRSKVTRIDSNENNIQEYYAPENQGYDIPIITKIEINDGKITIDGTNYIENKVKEIKFENFEDITEDIQNDRIGEAVAKKEFDFDSFEMSDAVAFDESFEVAHEEMVEYHEEIATEIDSKVTKESNEKLNGSLDAVAKPPRVKRKYTKKPKIMKLNRRKVIDGDRYPNFNYEAFERDYKVKIKLLTIEEQKLEIVARKTSDNYCKSPYSCDLCGKGYNHEESFKNHMSFHDPKIGPYECRICHFYCASSSRLLKHGDKHRITFTCLECGHISRGDRTVAIGHYESHDGKIYKCLHCDNSYLRKSSYFNHMRVSHPSKNVSCDECGETFLSARGVRCHKILAHRPNVEKPKSDLECSICGVQFSDKTALDAHTSSATDATHLSLKPCVSCGENCRSDEELATHVSQCERREQFHCKECNQTFPNNTSFEMHYRRKHLDEHYNSYRPSRGKPLPDGIVCEVCGKLVKTKLSLQNHLRVHGGLKPFACTECPKTFSLKVCLQEHMRTHTGEMPYQCNICERRFALRSNLQRHIKCVHLGERRYTTCDLCGKTLSDPGCLRLHIRTVHNNMPQPRRKRRRPKKEPAYPAVEDNSN